MANILDSFLEFRLENAVERGEAKISDLHISLVVSLEKLYY